MSLYAGAGGMDAGFALAGFTPSWVSELDPVALQTNTQLIHDLQLPHIEQAEPAKTFPGDILEILQTNPPTPADGDVVIGGPPCQGFSVAGHMDPDDERSKHVFHYFEAVAAVRPKVFVLENVKNLFQNPRWEGVRVLLRQRAAELGYRADMFLLNASHYNVPQKRERMMFIGFRNDLHITPTIPEPSTAANPPTVRDTLNRLLPHYGLPGNDTKCRAIITPCLNPVLRVSPFAGMLFNGAGRPINPDAPANTLPATMGGNRTPIIDQANLDDPTQQLWFEWYLQHLRGGGAVVNTIPPRLRRLTVEEAAVIQTFPANTRFSGPVSKHYRQIGNAVPVRLAYAVATHIRELLNLSS